MTVSCSDSIRGPLGCAGHIALCTLSLPCCCEARGGWIVTSCCCDARGGRIVTCGLPNMAVVETEMMTATVDGNGMNAPLDVTLYTPQIRAL